jgi:hypothetical protein
MGVIRNTRKGEGPATNWQMGTQNEKIDQEEILCAGKGRRHFRRGVS